MAKEQPRLILIVDELLQNGFTLDDVQREFARRLKRPSRSAGGLRGHKKHIAPKASALEIQEAVGVTAADRALSRKVIHKLGYDVVGPKK
jgi:hypothetical protein